jgi:hypothetical protein
MHHPCHASSSPEARLRNSNPTCFQVKQASISWRVPPHRLHPPNSFMAQQINRSPLDFEVQTKNPSWWFWGTNHQTIAVGFEAQAGKSEATDFKVKLGEIIVTSFEVKLGVTVDLGFESKPRNSRSSSPCARCKLHKTSSDLPIFWSLSTWYVPDYPQSSTPGLLLLSRSSSLSTMSHLSPAHHKINKRDSLHKIEGRVESSKPPIFKI